MAMEEKDIRGLFWLAAMFTGLMLMIPMVWLYNELLAGLDRMGVQSADWIRDLLGLAVAMVGPALTIQKARRYLDRRYPERP